MFRTILFLPLYNALVVFTQIFNGSLGWAVVGLTILVKLLLAPLAHKATITQLQHKKLAPLVNEIKKKFPNQKDQALKLNELYKEHKANPLSGCVVLLIQLPVLFAIFYVFKEGAVIEPANLYAFVTAPAVVNPMWLGIDITQPNILLLIITAAVQYAQMALSPSMQASNDPVDTTDTQAMMAASMQKTMKYIIPVVIIAGGWTLPGAVLIYWVVSSLFMIIQERLTMKLLAKKSA
jgi:YidC/Oxa1 family membrane protein insertase